MIRDKKNKYNWTKGKENGKNKIHSNDHPSCTSS